jgi:TM2 domain-containing membrane protein YozV
MLQTPLEKVTKNILTVIFMWLLMFLVYTVIMLAIFPLYYEK